MKRGLEATILIGLMLSGMTWVAAGETETPMIGIPNAVVIEDGILGGGQPDEAALRDAADAGYRTIVNLRTAGERGALENEDALVQSLGMNYVVLPIRGGQTYNEHSAKRLAEILAEPSALPAMVHCASGNRVGILFGVKAFYVDGLDGPAALEFATRAGARRIPVDVQTLLVEDDDD